MADLDFSELEELLQSATATPAPWCQHPNGTSIWEGLEWSDWDDADMPARHVVSTARVDERSVSDIALIVALRNQIGSVLDELKASRERGERLQALLSQVMAQSEHDTVGSCLLWDELSSTRYRPEHAAAVQAWLSAERSRRSERLKELAEWREKLWDPRGFLEWHELAWNSPHDEHSLIRKSLAKILCQHPETIRGLDIPRRYGSYRSAICTNCLSFRSMTHHGDPVGPWRPNSEYAAATASDEDT